MTLEKYLALFAPMENLSIEDLWKELDRVWDDLALDNKRTLSSQSQRVAEFYRHPVWVLNGIFSEIDPISRNHRVAIARRIRELGVQRVADYGGGSGVLARFICAESDNICVDIVEPFPSPFFLEKTAGHDRIRYVSEFTKGYDLIVAQDVLEHVDDPIGLTVKLIRAVRQDGYLLFANCFAPVIKCHLPSTFYLRHQFTALLRLSGLQYIGPVRGATHALVFKKRENFKEQRFKRLARIGKTMPWPHRLETAIGRFRRKVLRHKTG